MFRRDKKVSFISLVNKYAWSIRYKFDDTVNLNSEDSSNAKIY